MTYVPNPPIIREYAGATREEQARYDLALRKWLDGITFAASRISFRNSVGTVATGTKGHNVDGIWFKYTSNGTANTEDTIAHGLGRTPLGIFTGMTDKDAVIYDSGTAWTSTNIFLKSTAVTTVVNIFIF